MAEQEKVTAGLLGFINLQTCDVLGPDDFMLVSRQHGPAGGTISLAGRIKGKVASTVVFEPARIQNGGEHAR